MEPRHIRDKHPEKAQLIREYLEGAFGEELRESEEFERDTLIFRTPDGGFVVFSEEFLADQTFEQVDDRLKADIVGERAKDAAIGERLTVTNDGTFVEQESNRN